MLGISRDGSTMIGTSGGSGPNTNEAYTWTAAGGWNMLPALPGVASPYNNRPFGTNRDGSIVVGLIENPQRHGKAVLWQAGTVLDLGTPAPGWEWGANAVNDLGTVVVGSAGAAGQANPRAALWTQGSGTMFLSDYLAGYGVSVPAGWSPLYCTGVSASGNVICGDAVASDGVTTMGFVATVPVPSSVVVVACAAGLGLRRRRR